MIAAKNRKQREALLKIAEEQFELIIKATKGKKSFERSG
ncbi:hypothetical protein CWATWH0003_0742t1 [Crocosphaera watsonii WH 0003]|uniref:Uncharacterized protein n=1 Tax=Crocosphaera watsonii WH 0003 TaxID=423471 RepID=G5IZQ2_CROWT|nr:hypothetical protein CWATWH0003_0742t1 [Crocosphaera watsonii WH 0003]